MNGIREKLIRVSGLVDGGELERDLALQLLREAYSEIKFGAPEPVAPVAPVAPEFAPAPEPYIETEHTVFEVEPIEPAPEPDPQFDPVPVLRQAQDAAPWQAQEPEPVAELVEAFVPRPAVRPEVIRSLYGDGALRQAQDGAPRRETLNDTAHPETLGDAPRTETLGDALRPETRDVASAAAAAATPVGASLRKAIGLNDRFVMNRDMFRGDTAAFDRTIDQLDRFGGLDEAVIWLHDNFALDPDSEGVGLLMSLLERRFS